MYIQPVSNGATAVPVIAPVRVGTTVAAPVARGPSQVDWLYLPVNAMVISITLTCLVFVAQQSVQRFNLRTMLAFFVLIACLFGLLRIAQSYGFGEAYLMTVFLSPIGIALYFHLVGVPNFKWNQLRWLSNSSPSEKIEHFATAEDAFAAATRLERRGEWSDAINLINAAVTRWPVHGKYAAKCVASIKEKQA